LYITLCSDQTFIYFLRRDEIKRDLFRSCYATCISYRKFSQSLSGGHGITFSHLLPYRTSNTLGWGMQISGA